LCSNKFTEAYVISNRQQMASSGRPTEGLGQLS